MNSVVIGGIVRIDRKTGLVKRMRIFPEEIWELIKEFLLYKYHDVHPLKYVRYYNLHRRVELMLRRAYRPQDIADDTFLDVSDYRPLCRGFHMTSEELMESVNCWTYEDWNRTKLLEYKVEVKRAPDSYTMGKLARDITGQTEILMEGEYSVLLDAVEEGGCYVYESYAEVVSSDGKIANRRVTVRIGVDIGGKRLITPEMIAHIRDCKARGVFDVFPAITDYDELAFVIPEHTEYQDVSIAEFYKL